MRKLNNAIPAKAGIHGGTDITGGTVVSMDARLRGHDIEGENVYF